MESELVFAGNRGRVYDYILHHPGRTLGEVAEAFHLTHHTIGYHAHRLHRRGLIHRQVAGQRVCLYPADGAWPPSARFVDAYNHGRTGTLLTYLAEHNNIPLANVGSLLHANSPSTMHYHVTRLIRVGLALPWRRSNAAYGDHRRVVLYATPKLREGWRRRDGVGVGPLPLSTNRHL